MASTKSFLSILAGLAAGAAIGILYAPDKGWKTRARVKKAAANGYEDMKENLGDLGAKVDEKTAEAKETINSLRKLLVEQLERLENALKQAEEAAEESVGNVPDDQDIQA